MRNHLTYKLLLKVLILISTGCFMGCKPVIPVDEDPFVRFTGSIDYQSQMLNRPLRYSVYLPAGYNIDNKSYPTVYLLHGFGDNEISWMNGGKIDRIIKELEEKGEIEPMIYVMPQGYNNYYVNRFNGTLNYMDMFVEEFVPMIDSLYRTKKTPGQRAVVGYSMGGYGALILPVKNPDIFSVSVPLSMSFRTDEQYVIESQSAFDVQWGPIFGAKGSTGNDRLTEYFKTYSPFHFFANEDANNFSTVRFFIDCGDDEESLTFTNNEMHALMRSRNIAHEYRVRNGAHTWDYWLKSMREALVFIQTNFDEGAYVDDPSFNLSTGFSGNIEQLNFNGKTLNVVLPSGYSASSATYPVMYFMHHTLQNRLDETKNVMALLDSLQREKQFILIEADANDFKTPSNLVELCAFVDNGYRTKKQKQGRLLLANFSGASVAYHTVSDYPELFESLFLYQPFLDSITSIPEVGFIYLDTTDESQSYSIVQGLYSDCRKQNINHQYRVRNGKDSFNAFMHGLNNSIVYLGLMLNKTL